MQRSRDAPYRPLPSYMTSLRGRRWQHTPQIWRWPAFWALLAGMTVQIVAGIVPSSISFLLLAAADQTRCPVAIGAERMRPFYAWVVGVVVGIIFCQYMTGETRTVGYSWIMCGSFATVIKWYYKSKL